MSSVASGLRDALERDGWVNLGFKRSTVVVKSQLLVVVAQAKPQEARVGGQHCADLLIVQPLWYQPPNQSNKGSALGFQPAKYWMTSRVPHRLILFSICLDLRA